MLKAWDKFPLAASGWGYLLAALALAGVASALRVWPLALPLWCITGWIAWFFRDPARLSLAGPSAVISPADGKVVAVEEAACPELPGGRAVYISIFMNIFDVHVNRAPLEGSVEAITRHPGGFRPANQPQARLENERVSLLLAAPAGQRILVTQVAGLVARRIECWLTPGDFVRRGQRYGMIRFGSRLDVYLPLGTKIKVGLGQRVRAGETILGEL